MKCPKCEYLGFDTSDRCRHCGYQFSLLSHEGAGPRSVPPETPDHRPRGTAGTVRTARTLPLFGTDGPADDEPLIRLPRTPRPPLAVRRTPASPRTRASARAARAPVLLFPEAVPAAEPAAPASVGARTVFDTSRVSSGGRRVAAAAIDHALLLAVDVVVLYLTLRMAALPMSEWHVVPPGPMIAFLAFLKMAYFGVFTACGGQTIGKMAIGLRVVADDDNRLDAARVLQRTVLGGVSVLTLGLAFVPAVLSPDGRALHDRVARTRVVDAPTA